MLLTVNNNSNIIIQASNQGIQQLSDHTHPRSDLNPPSDEKTLFTCATYQINYKFTNSNLSTPLFRKAIYALLLRNISFFF